MSFKVSVFKVREDNYSYLIYSDELAICIDPFDYKLIYDALERELTELKIYTTLELQQERKIPQRNLLYCLNTHWHKDHSGGNDGLKELIPNVRLITNKDISLENLNIYAIPTPCHTKDSVSFYMDGKQKYLFTGDTVFFLGCGMFFEGNEIDMYNSLNEIVKRVDKNTLMMYGHDYNDKNISFVENVVKSVLPKEIKSKKFLTLEEEMKYNPFFNALSKGTDELKVLREKKNEFGLGSKK
ncbi:hypothetical protein H311_00252 [Anncaliia algerae PRA109]|nr:hypothetical protein H311_00252 [Anncaliia algerae PRA109]